MAVTVDHLATKVDNLAICPQNRSTHPPFGMENGNPPEVLQIPPRFFRRFWGDHGEIARDFREIYGRFPGDFEILGEILEIYFF